MWNQVEIRLEARSRGFHLVTCEIITCTPWRAMMTCRHTPNAALLDRN